MSTTNENTVTVDELAEDHDLPRWKVVKMVNDMKHAGEVRAGPYYYSNLDADSDSVKRSYTGGLAPETPGPLPRGGKMLAIDPQ